MIVDKLVDICRKLVNQLVARENVGELKLPKDLEQFLCYEDIQATQPSTSMFIPNNNLVKPASSQVNKNNSLTMNVPCY
jgi:hypothetical protein